MASLVKDKKKKKKDKSSKLDKDKSFFDSRFKFKIPKMMKFDIKKVHVKHESDKNRYFSLVSVELVRNFAQGPSFNNFELFYLLN